jgi:hypothetical protein
MAAQENVAVIRPLAAWILLLSAKQPQWTLTDRGRRAISLPARIRAQLGPPRHNPSTPWHRIVLSWVSHEPTHPHGEFQTLYGNYIIIGKPRGRISKDLLSWSQEGCNPRNTSDWSLGFCPQCHDQSGRDHDHG